MERSVHDGSSGSNVTQVAWDQNQVSGSSGITTIQADTVAIQQLLSSNMVANGISPGEVMYVMVGDVTYQIVGPTKPGDEVTINPVNSGISLEDLAAISAEQESIKPEFAYQMPVISATTSECVTSQNEIAQQFIQTSGNVFTSNDGMQVIMMSGDDSTKAASGNTIKLDGQDFVLQPGQQLPADIQDMISKGLPVDLSNYEFVIEGEPSHEPSQNFVLHHGTDDVNTLNSLKTGQIAGGNITGNEPQPKNGIYVQVITACPGEFDDGEFTYLTSDTPEQNVSNEPRIIPNTAYLDCYLEFVKNGAKIEASGQSNRQSEDKQTTGILGKSSFISNQQFNKTLKRKKPTDSDGEAVEKTLRSGDYDDPTWKLGSYRSDDQRTVSRSNRGKNRGRVPPFGSPTNRSSALVTQHDITKLHILNSEPQFEFPVSYIMQNEPHNFFKGDFVVDKKDAYKSEFPIWRIENGKLLQKFDPFFDGSNLYHKSASVYSSWSGDIRTNYKPILADIVSASSAPAGRKQDIVVRVHDKYIPKPADDGLEQNALMQFFNIYVHALLNQVFSPTYLASIQQQNVEYLLEPIAQIDQLILEAKQAVLSEFNWNSDFQSVLENWSCYTFVTLKPGESVQMCQALNDGSPAIRTVKFYGQSYDRESLTVTQESPIANSQDFAVGKVAFDNLGIYHALHHFKYLLFKKCYEEAVYHISTLNKGNDDIPNICAQNRIWVQQMFRDLKGLLDRYIIIKTEEDGGDPMPAADDSQEVA